MAKEIERKGIPTALVTAMIPLAVSVGASRIIPGRAIPYPLGDPTLPADEEKDLRRHILAKALEALQTSLPETKVFAD